jgi:glycerophosphoryl diester phosphodiesterase
MNSSVQLVYHAARGPHPHPANSIAAFQACLAVGARVVEMDISPLADGDFALVHGPSLERSTTGSGPVSAQTAGEVRSLYFVWQGVVTDDPVRLLSDALELVRSHPHPVELQLDLKPHAPLTDAILARLVETLQPVRDRVRVTSMADWALRRLRALDADLALGIDPFLYLDVDSAERRDPTVPPFRLGAYGYWDDHPLATQHWGKPADYLAARSEALWVQAPTGAAWYIHAGLLAQALDDGFDWIAHLHLREAQAAAWTLDSDQPEQVALARRLIALGVDRITTNDAPALARALGVPVTY